jgi:hypothetical protein
MPRVMRALASEFSTAALKANHLAIAGETARVLITGSKGKAQPLNLDRIELLYEMAFLRLFLEWETFLEQSFLRYLCGYSGIAGTARMVQGGYYSNLAAAEAAVLGGKQYKLWHNPQHVINRAKGFMQQGLHETVLSSNIHRLQQFAAVRHRIAHAQVHARLEFDNATMALTARRYRGAKAGRFLRDWVSGTTPPQRWLEAITRELTGLAGQIAP